MPLVQGCLTSEYSEPHTLQPTTAACCTVGAPCPCPTALCLSPCALHTALCHMPLLKPCCAMRATLLYLAGTTTPHHAGSPAPYELPGHGLLWPHPAQLPKAETGRRSLRKKPKLRDSSSDSRWSCGGNSAWIESPRASLQPLRGQMWPTGYQLDSTGLVLNLVQPLDFIALRFL